MSLADDETRKIPLADFILMARTADSPAQDLYELVASWGVTPMLSKTTDGRWTVTASTANENYSVTAATRFACMAGLISQLGAELDSDAE